MVGRICENCEDTTRKKNGYLCHEIMGNDGLPVRCIHGGTLLKLELLNYYLEIFCQAMKGEFPNRVFIDLFSGPGLCINKEIADKREFVFGSSMLALKQKPPFTKYIFVDLNSETLNILSERCKSKFPKLLERITFMNKDANNDITNIITGLIPQQTIYVVFIDPNGLDIHHKTIKELSKFPQIDIIINVSVFDSKLNENWNLRGISKKADLFFGTGEWRNTDKRHRLALYKQQLKKLGFLAVEGDEEGSITVKTKTSAPIYHLAYASKHKLGLKFWQEAKKRHRDPDLFI